MITAQQSFTRDLAFMNDERIAQFNKEPSVQAIMLQLVGAGVLTEEQFRVMFNCRPLRYIPGKRASSRAILDENYVPPEPEAPPAPTASTASYTEQAETEGGSAEQTTGYDAYEAPSRRRKG